LSQLTKMTQPGGLEGKVRDGQEKGSTQWRKKEENKGGDHKMLLARNVGRAKRMGTVLKEHRGSGEGKKRKDTTQKKKGENK